jgi:hypothetical protein
LVSFSVLQSSFRKFTGKKPIGHAGVKGVHRHKVESPFYEFMAVSTSWKSPSNFPRELRSENPAKMLFLSKNTDLRPTAPHIMPCHVLIESVLSHEMKNKTQFGRIFEILISYTVSGLAGMESSEILETERSKDAPRGARFWQYLQRFGIVQRWVDRSSFWFFYVSAVYVLPKTE